GAAQYVNALQRAGYATDPHYAKKILTLMERAPIAGAGAQAAQAASSMKI
ncbi:MAG: flagellum-specific peptidoglycan hydrolase FlgJ, partial [Gammaproteobacteria bacterium]